MIIFENDDSGYLQWVNANPDGFVINAPKHPGSFPDMLHKASCQHISTPQRTNYTTTDFKKICSMSKEALTDWGHNNSENFQQCKHCSP